jgi:hypothetical protein
VARGADRHRDAGGAGAENDEIEMFGHRRLRLSARWRAR